MSASGASVDDADESQSTPDAILDRLSRLSSLLLSDRRFLECFDKYLSVPDARIVAEQWVPLATAAGRLPWTAWVVLSDEFETRARGNTVLRGNNLAFQVIDTIIRPHVVGLLTGATGPTIRTALGLDDIVAPAAVTDFEIDSNRFDDTSNVSEMPADELIERNRVALERAVSSIVESVLSVDVDALLAPQPVSVVFAYLVHLCDQHNVDFVRLAGSILLLRYLNPTILAPDSSQLVATGVSLSARARRNCVLVAKVLQALATGVQFGIKEPFMISLNPFLDIHTPRMVEFIRKLAAAAQLKIPLPQLLSMDPSVTVSPATIPSLRRAVDFQALTSVMMNYLNQLGDVLSKTEASAEIASAEKEWLEIIEQLSSDFQNEMLGNAARVRRNTIIASKANVPVEVEVKLNTEEVSRMQKLRRESMSADLSALDNMHVFYHQGVDKNGYPILIFVSENLPEQCPALTFDNVLMLLIRKLDQIGDREYALLYCHSNNAAKRFPLKWVRDLHRYLEYRYRKNMKKLYVLHPSSMLQLLIRVVRAFTSVKFFQKVVYVKSIAELYRLYVPKAECPFPVSVLEVDHSASGEDLRADAAVVAGYSGSATDDPRAAELVSDASFFGSTLVQMMRWYPNRRMPDMLERILALLELSAPSADGIFRVSSSHQRLTFVGSYLDAGDFVDLSVEDVHLVGGLLKKFLRELRDPLIPGDSYSSVVAIASNTELDEEKLVSVLSSIPPVNRYVLSRLLQLLARVAARSDVNQMTCDNLARIFAPSLLRTVSNSVTSALMDTPKCIRVISHLIRRAEYFRSRLE